MLAILLNCKVSVLSFASAFAVIGVPRRLKDAHFRFRV